MKKFTTTNQWIMVLLCYLFVSCEDYLEIEAPDHKIVSETVFSEDQTAISAMKGVFNQLATVFFSNGGPDSVTALGGLSSDEVAPINTNNIPYGQFDQHRILPDNFRNLNLWSSAYNIIYMTNALLEGLENSQNISESVRERLQGEARFVRAFSYFYLVNLYGDVPLLLTSDYRLNSLAKRDASELVYEQIENDLQTAINLLDDTSLTGERTHVNRSAALALMARVKLYLEQWVEAEILSSEVIAQSGKYEILEDLNQVFMANSREAIWQLTPIGRGAISTHTLEGATFIIHPVLTFLSHLKLSDNFIDSFEERDQRLAQWIGYHQRTGFYYPFKYKIRNSTDEVSEYSMVLRLAEQYLIRAEARANQSDLTGSMADLDKIRERAGLDLVSDFNPTISKEALLDLIIEERKREFFTEWGHRWLDLKRTQRTGQVLGLENPLWEETDVFYPIPETELMKNPNLTQNPGY